MGKRVLTCYDTGCLLDQLSFAQEMRESHLGVGIDNHEDRPSKVAGESCKRPLQACDATSWMLSPVVSLQAAQR
jgi:hypothetical protein